MSFVPRPNRAAWVAGVALIALLGFHGAAEGALPCAVTWRRDTGG